MGMGGMGGLNLSGGGMGGLGLGLTTPALGAPALMAPVLGSPTVGTPSLGAPVLGGPGIGVGSNLGLGANLGTGTGMGLGFSGLNPTPNSLLPTPSPLTVPLITPAHAAPTGPVQPNMIAVSNVVADVNAEQLRGVFEAFGKINKCEMKIDPVTGKHSGTGFIEFLDEKSTKDCVAMNGFDLCGQKIKLTPVYGPSPFSEVKPESRVVGLRNMVSSSEVDPELEDEIREECESFAPDKTKPCVEKVVVHIHPSKNVTIFVLFVDKEVARKAKVSMHGRWFGGKTVQTDFFSEDKFNAREFD